MILFSKSSKAKFLSTEELKECLYSALDRFGSTKKMLIVPPDHTRLHSGAGMLTRFVYERSPQSVSMILPALGTHCAMTSQELTLMFGDIPQNLFQVHEWRSDCVNIGEVPADFVNNASGGQVEYSIPVTIDRRLVSLEFDCILSIGQIVPHEVAGFAGHNKNLFVGLGGQENINKSHFLGAVFGMERIMGRSATPVRSVFNYAMDTFLPPLPIVHVLTVMDRDTDGSVKPRGIFIGTDRECFEQAADLSQRVNISLLDEPLSKVVVYLDPVEYKSFWLGNKSIYRTRMAIADKGSLVVLAPGIDKFGEDPEIDRLIRAYGYRTTSVVLDAVKNNAELANNLSAAAHLIHGSSEERFNVTYCPGKLSRAEVEGVGFSYADVSDMMRRYDPKQLKDGFNTLQNGEKIFFISNPALGLWAARDLFNKQ